MATEVLLARVDEALSRCQELLEKHYHSNHYGSGWYHRLSSEKPGPTATALGLQFFHMREIRFDHCDEALSFLKERQVRSSVRDRAGGWAINTSFGIPVVEATAWVAQYMAAARLEEKLNAPSLDSAYSWLSSNQNDDGGWGSLKGQPSRIYLTSLALRAMLAANPSGDDITAKAIDWLLSVRTADQQGWGVTPNKPLSQTHTAMALLALRDGIGFDWARLRPAYGWLRESYDPAAIVDETAKIESYNVETIVNGRTVTWHNSLPHYSAPFTLLALMTDREERISEVFLQGIDTVLSKQETAGNWPNVEGGSEPSIWSVWPFSHALHQFRSNPMLGKVTRVGSSNGVVLIYPSSMKETEAVRVIRDDWLHLFLRVIKRQWATLIVSIFIIGGAILSMKGTIKWKDFFLSLIFPVILLLAQEIANRRPSVGGRDRPGPTSRADA